MERRAIGEVIMGEVHRPALGRCAEIYAEHARRRAAPPLGPLALLRQPFVAIELRDALVVDGPALATSKHVQMAMTGGDPRLRQLSQAAACDSTSSGSYSW